MLVIVSHKMGVLILARLAAFKPKTCRFGNSDYLGGIWAVYEYPHPHPSPKKRKGWDKLKLIDLFT